jgi:CubicO group peptidase (beta-lactamase class C family)
MNRRELLQAAAAASLTTASGLLVAETPVDGAKGQKVSRYGAIFPQLDRYVAQFMHDMRAPGMTLVLADRDGTQRIATYGLGDREARLAVKPDQLFQIGSISKSFVALALLQLSDEGKLDLHRPIVEYLPWLRIESSFAPITVHHLLTHGSGLPSPDSPLLSDPSQKHRAAYAPGEHFHYNNMAYETLGYLAETLDGRELPEIIRARILQPLEMTATEPAITLDMRERLVKSYCAFQPDRPLPRNGRLCEAPGIVVTGGAGCVASTPADMGKYVRMIANEGVGPHGRLISEKSFGLFTTPHIEAEGGPGVGYGYGLFTDTLDGRKIVRHTGGMVSFASSMVVDLETGVCAFSSINAMQGYRPSPVMNYALQLMAASVAGKALPPLPPVDSATSIPKAREYASIYKNGQRSLDILAVGDSLFLTHQGARVQLESAGEPDHFLVLHRDFDRYQLVFGRKTAGDEKSPVVEASWGPDWYTTSAYSGPQEFDHPKEWQQYAGHYRNESPWFGSVRIVLRKGQLLIDGVIPLEQQGDYFYLRDEADNPEWIRFGEIVNGRCMRIKFSGSDFWRVAAA